MLHDAGAGGRLPTSGAVSDLLWRLGTKKVGEYSLGDKDYDSSGLAVHIEEEFEADVVISSRKNAKEPREIDRELYRDHNKAERFIGHVTSTTAA